MDSVFKTPIQESILRKQRISRRVSELTAFATALRSRIHLSPYKDFKDRYKELVSTSDFEGLRKTQNFVDQFPQELAVLWGQQYKLLPELQTFLDEEMVLFKTLCEMQELQLKI